MKVLATILMAASMLTSIAHAEVQPQNCEERLTKVTTTLLEQEGMNEINTCWGMGSSWNCELVFSGCQDTEVYGVRACFLRYIYGGAYYNYNDYTFKVGTQCEVNSLEIQRL